MTVAVAERWEIGSDEARRYAGKWVAIKDGQVAFGSDDVAEVVAWLKRGRISADLVIHLPERDAPKIWVL